MKTLEALDQTVTEAGIYELFAHKKVGVWTVRAFAREQMFEEQATSLRDALEALVLKVAGAKGTPAA